MNCIEANEKMAGLFDDSVSQETKEELFAHFRDCSDCRTLYEEMSKAMAELKPRVSVNASRNLHAGIMDQVLKSGNPYQARRGRILPMLTPVWKKVAAIAAILVVLFILIPVFNRSGAFQIKASAATTLLKNSMHALSDIKSMYMEFEVRTLEGDNFEYIDRNSDFVEHKIWAAYGDTARWRIEKPGRTVVMDGKNQFLYTSESGIAIKSGPDAGYVEWMKILLDPVEILRKEKAFASGEKGTYAISENGNTIVLTVHAKALGDFRNTYALNKSIPESNTRRVYTFEKPTSLLKSFEMYIESAGKETKILEVKTIKYNEPVEQAVFTITLPAGTNWVTAKEIYKQAGIAGITGEEAAKMFFNACHNEDWKTVRQLIPGLMNFVQMEFIVKAEYGGLTVISIGKPFKSGRYPGEFVPYTIRKKTGSIKTHKLAVRNDNPEKKWTVDGGF